MTKQALTYLSLPWVGTILGLIGVALAILFYARSKRRARLACQITEFSVIGGQQDRFPTELQISFAGQPVDRVTSSRVVIWNAGNVTLNATDIVTSDPLRLEIDGGAILRASVQRVTRDVVGIALGSSPQSDAITNVTFDFLDQGDGIAATILHSGARNALKCKGTIKGVPGGVTNIGAGSDISIILRPFSKLGAGRFFPLIIPLILGLVATVGGFLWPYLSTFLNKIDTSVDIATTPNWPVVFAGLFYASMPSFILWYYRRRYPAALQELVPNKKRDEIPEQGTDNANSNLGGGA